MANPEANNNFGVIVSELEQLVDVWKKLGNLYMNSGSITNLITQKLDGLVALDENEICGTSWKELGRLVEIRKTLIELENCSGQEEYEEFCQNSDTFIGKTIFRLSAARVLESGIKSDLEYLEM